MRVDGLDSANAGAQESESKSPAFQIIVLVRSYYYVYSIIFPPYLYVSAPFLQSPFSTVLVWTFVCPPYRNPCCYVLRSFYRS